jgi:hypothetical protein
MNNGISNTDLENLGKKLIGNDFIGVFPSDFIPDIYNKKTFCIIFNLAPHYSKGTHFVAIISNRHQTSYFDSFGKTCQNKNIKKFIKTISKNKYTYYNKQQIQDKTSIFCSLFCLYFLCECYLLNKPLRYFNSLFTMRNNLSENDKIVVKLLIKFIKNRK